MRFVSIVAIISALALFSIGEGSASEKGSIFERQSKELQSMDFNPSKPSGDYCFSEANIKIVDTSVQVDPDFLRRMKSFGVEAIARFYGYTNEDRPPDGSKVTPFQAQKVITENEIRLLKINGMTSIAVFQYLSDSEETFANWKVRAAADANRALDLASKLKQPKKTAIYFGADGDFVHNLKRPCKRVDKDKVGNCTQEVRNYFSTVSDLLKKRDYNVGVYGSGATCEMLTRKGLVKYCWLSFSTGHTNRQFGLTSEKTVLRQLVEAKSAKDVAKCGRRIDFNQASAKDFGQFNYE